jgi:membrane fusion protein, multidrug efflux system
VHAGLGDEVSKGKVVLSLDPYDPAHFAMNLKTAQAQYETAKEDSLRMAELFKSGAVSQQDLDHVRTATEVARANYLTARRAVELDTPIAGIVTAMNIQPEEYAASDQTLATISSYDRIRISLEISESDRAMIEIGQPVRLRAQNDGKNTVEGKNGDPVNAEDNSYLRGHVTKVALSADGTTRLFFVEAVVENPDHLLRPGTLVTPEILVAMSKDRPAVPQSALVTLNRQPLIYVIDAAGTRPVARLRPVTQGVEDGIWTVIVKGVSIGEQAVVQGQNKLEDGVKIKIHADRTAEYYGHSL